MLIIRQGKESDSEALAQLAEKTFRDTFSAQNSVSDMDLHCENRFRPDVQRQELLDNTIITILAELEAELVGFAQVRLQSHKEGVSAKCPAELYRLYVSNEWHGRGVAHQIMAEVFASAASAQCDGIWLGVWEHNPKAIAFYRKHGFEITGEHFFQLGDDHQRDLVMLARVGDSSIT